MENRFKQIYTKIILIKIMNDRKYHEFFRELKKRFNLTNEVIGNISGVDPLNIKNQTNISKPFPRQLKFAVWLYVKMKGSANKGVISDEKLKINRLFVKRGNPNTSHYDTTRDLISRSINIIRDFEKK